MVGDDSMRCASQGNSLSISLNDKSVATAATGAEYHDRSFSANVLLWKGFNSRIQNNNMMAVAAHTISSRMMRSRGLLPILGQTISSGSGASSVRHCECSGK